MLAEKLRYYVENGNIARERCIQIAKIADDAVTVYAKVQNMKELALAMHNCCGSDPDEAAFFRAAVDYALQEKWAAKPKDSAVLIGLMNMAYLGICSAMQDDHGDKLDEEPETFKKRISVSKPMIDGAAQPLWTIESGKPKSSGCLVLFGLIGIAPLGFYVARMCFV